MSWSKEGLYPNAGAAKDAIAADIHLPHTVALYIMGALDGIEDKTVPVWIKGHGHLCEGPGSYEVSSCDLVVKPMPFSVK